MVDSTQFDWFMGKAIEEAELAYKAYEVPVGAVIVDGFGKEICRSHNDKEKSFNPCGHAEILAIQKACKLKRSWRLEDCTLFVTLEPCPMCFELILQSRVKQCVFGAYDKKMGALSTGFYSFQKHKKTVQKMAVSGGVKHFECAQLLSSFFRERRSQYQEET